MEKAQTAKWKGEKQKDVLPKKVFVAYSSISGFK